MLCTQVIHSLIYNNVRRTVKSSNDIASLTEDTNQLLPIAAETSVNGARYVWHRQPDTDETAERTTTCKTYVRPCLAKHQCRLMPNDSILHSAADTRSPDNNTHRRERVHHARMFEPRTLATVAMSTDVLSGYRLGVAKGSDGAVAVWWRRRHQRRLCMYGGGGEGSMDDDDDANKRKAECTH